MKTKRSVSIWDRPGVVELHRREWEAGTSPQAIADKMTTEVGYSFTRNMVLGRAFRNGMANSRPVVKTKTARYTAWTSQQDAMVLRDYAMGRKLYWIADQFFRDFGVRVGAYDIKKRLVDLGRCRPQSLNLRETVQARPREPEAPAPPGEPGCPWISGTDTMACGKPISEGAYCTHHAAIAYRQPPARIRTVLFRRRNQYDP